MIPANFETIDWQMTLGERAAVEGVLAQTKPTFALEIGSAEGGSLDRTAAHSVEVHSFDLVAPHPRVQTLTNITFHTGDSHALLAPWLKTVEAEGHTIDYVMIDGDHTTEGVFRDITDVLTSPAFQGVMLMHDTMNEAVRAGVARVELERFGVRYADLDFVSGHVTKRRGIFENQLWGGLGLIIRHPSYTTLEEYTTAIRQDRFHALQPLAHQWFGLRRRQHRAVMSIKRPLSRVKRRVLNG